MPDKKDRPRRTLPVLPRPRQPERRSKSLPLAPILHGPGGTESTATHELLREAPYWDNLRLDGYIPGAEGEAVELRRCPQCGSTIGKQIPADSVLSRLSDSTGVIARSLDAMSSPSGSPRAPRGPGSTR